MLSISHPVDSTHTSLGERRGISDLARVALDLARAPKREEPYIAATSPAYPSPPISGSSPLPPRLAHDAGVGGRGPPPGGYPSASSEDAYRVNLALRKPNEHRGTPNMPPSLPSLFQQETPDRMSYPYPRPEDSLSRPTPYPPTGPPGMAHQQNYLPIGGPNTAGAYPVPTRPPTIENQQISSPKSQRKTKGHVASACVPCKRAHLRCDAQRPCSRCLTNGKEDSCVDVQHKKRGRPRLRDDRDARYDPSRFQHPQDVTMRRPLSIYPSGSSISSGYETSPPRLHSGRVLNSLSSEQLAPRYSNRTSPSDAATSSIVALAPEPVAFLNMKLEITKVSPSFVDAIGGGKVEGRNLTEAVSPFDQHKLEAIRTKLHESQTRQEPNYLPPILGSLDHIIQRLGFTAEDIGRFQLEYSYYLKFIAPEGWREYRVRIGLAKEGSIYFVVLLLDVHDPYSWKPNWKSRETQIDASRAPAAQMPASLPTYPHHNSLSTMSDQGRSGFSDGSFTPRPPPGSLTQFQPESVPGSGAQVRSYSASPSHAQYSGPSPSYHIPRSELSPVTRHPHQPSYQLPPIRAQPEQVGPPGTQAWPREDRPSRVDIGGLIDKPDASGRPR